MIRRAGAIAFWAVPPLLALVLYWPGLTAWFQKDDFAWLGLRGLVHSWRDMIWVLFTPLAQGTVRTLSERVFYVSFYSAFGMNPLPYRLLAFATFAATLAMLTVVCAKLTGSRPAAFWAALLWTANGALAVPLSWTAVYYELLWPFFLLLDIWFLLRYIETGERRYYVAQWITFVLGFFVLELNVVYPALAVALALCRAPRVIRKLLPLFALSALYTALHVAAAPLHSSGPYRMYWNSTMISTLGDYWKMAMGPNRLIVFNIHPSLFRSTLTMALSAGLLGFVGWKVRRREWLPAFFLAWFVIVLAPVLPLRDHISDYYLTVPLIGLAMLAGYALVSAWRAGRGGRAAALILLTIYLCVSVPVARVTANSFHRSSHEIRKVVMGIASVNANRPERLILLTGVSSDMFWSAFYHRPLRLFGIDNVYLLPENAAAISAGPRIGDTSIFFIDSAGAGKALLDDRASVYDVSGGTARDVTADYRAAASFHKR